MKMPHAIAALTAVSLLALSAHAGSVEPREGWAVHDTEHSYQELLDRVKSAVETGGMAVVTEAGPTETAASRGIEIPGNRVLGVFHVRYALRVIKESVPAMIEAPIRMYVTEDEDGTATLSYKKPSFVFQPYMKENGGELEEISQELDKIFSGIATIAIR